MISGFFHLVRRKKFQTLVKSVIVLEKICNFIIITNLIHVLHSL